MAPDSFASSLSVCFFCACAFPVEMDPTKVCSGKGAVTLRATPSHEGNRTITSPCPQDAEQPESKCWKLNWNLLLTVTSRQVSPGSWAYFIIVV